MYRERGFNVGKWFSFESLKWVIKEVTLIVVILIFF